MSALLRFPRGGKHDPTIEEWLNKTDALTVLARVCFRKMRACGDDVLELCTTDAPSVCVDDAPFADVKMRLRGVTGRVTTALAALRQLRPPELAFLGIAEIYVSSAGRGAPLDGHPPVVMTDYRSDSRCWCISTTKPFRKVIS